MTLTHATARGVYLGITATLGITVRNVNVDDFGSYAGDGLDDAWQFQYFGQNNPNAAPTIDADGAGQNNRLEVIAGLVPIDATSRFNHRIEAVPGQPQQKRIVFGPRFASRIYSLRTSATLADGSWSPLTTGSAPSDNGMERTITDLSATAPKKFYEVQIMKP